MLSHMQVTIAYSSAASAHAVIFAITFVAVVVVVVVLVAIAIAIVICFDVRHLRCINCIIIVVSVLCCIMSTSV